MTKIIIDLIKVNIIFIIFLVVTGGCVYWLLQIQEDGRKFKSKISQSSKKKQAELQKLQKVKVVLPAKGPYEPSKNVVVPINRKAIEQLQAAYKAADDEKNAVESYILEKNEAKLQPMDLGLFPEMQASQRDKLIYLKVLYPQKFSEYFKPLLSSDTTGPRLNAGMPPSKEEITLFQKRIDEEYLRNFSTEKKLSDLNENEKKLLVEKKRARLLEWLTKHASKLHMYAVTDPKSADFPFEIDAWVNKTTEPDSHDLWESQMKLWVIETICIVMMKTNQTNNQTRSVLSEPIKRLLKFTVKSDYVGDTDRKTKKLVGNVTDSNKPLPSYFHLSPTGRQSNTIYDVRHALLSLIIDWKKLPEFLKNLSEHNLLAVLSVNVKDIDEYEALREGYVYGKLQDCVQVDILIESIWLREWMKPLMPKVVKAKLGVE